MSEPTAVPKNRRRRIPRSFKELTPSNHFNPRTFFYEMVWKTWFIKRTGEHRQPEFPPLALDQVGLTWIGHASFLAQFPHLNILIDPNFANWIFAMKRLKRAGVLAEDLPRIDLVLITHAHFDHLHRRSVKQLPNPSKLAVVPWGMGDLVKTLGFQRVIVLKWWESFEHEDVKVTLTPSQHWGARKLHDDHRGYGGFVLEHAGRTVFHAGDSAYSECFKEIGQRLKPEIALLPIGAYYPDSFRKVHMGPDEALKVFQELGSKLFVPMHYGSFKLSFEPIEEPPRLLRTLAEEAGLMDRLRLLEEGVPVVF